MVLWGGGGCGVGLRSGWLLSVRGGPLFPLRAGRGVGAGGVGGYSVRPGELLVLLGSVSGRWPMGEVLEVSVMAGLRGDLSFVLGYFFFFFFFLKNLYSSYNS